MRLLVLLLLVGVVCAQSDHFKVPGTRQSSSGGSRSSSSGRSSSGSSSRGSSSGGSGRRSSSSGSRSSRPSSSTRSLSSSSSSSGSANQVHESNGGSDYHFSWRAARGRKFSGGAADSYCRKLGSGWKAVSINDASENSYIVRKVGEVEYIWTSGKKSGNGWKWGDGSSASFTNWSHTGGRKRPQPDNRDGNENCISILNNFYKDGIMWHDVGCSHTKPVICEKPKA